MKWQKAAQLAIAALVVTFIVVLAVSMRRSKPPEQSKPATKLPDPQVQIYNPQGGKNVLYSDGKKVFDVHFGEHVGLADGRQLMSKGVKIFTTRNGRNLTINSQSAEISQKAENFEKVLLKGDVWLSGEGGMDIRTEEATYTESEGIVRMPGAVAFRKARLSGNGVGATYDLNREVLWLLDKATFSVQADKEGQGAMDGSAASVGMARNDHYVRMTKDAHINGDGRDIRADEIVITLTPDDERVQMLQLRGNSRITGGASGPQSMTAKDIDVTYGADGRTLQNANLMENAVLQLSPETAPGNGAAATGKRIAGRTINITLAPDGKTVTALTSTQNVQVDLPAESNGASKRIRSASLVANGTPDVGLRNATFTGKVNYEETRATGRNKPVVDRTAHSESLQIETKAGLGAIEKADFHGNVRFTAPDVVAEAQRGIYHVERDRIELMPSDGDPGPSANIVDARISVQARTIEFTIGTRDMTADTKVRSRILGKPSGRGQQSKVPSVLKQNEPVNVTSNRLQYQGTASKAVYSGDVQLWQGDDVTIKGDTLALDDKTGNLDVNGNASTRYVLEETDEKTGEKKRTPTLGKSKTFVFDDARRVGTYTGNAQLDGAHGNLTADKIEIFLKPNGNEVDRLEAYAQGTEVVIREGKRRTYGKHLTYTASDDKYLMIGTPVEVIEQEDEQNCKHALATDVQFYQGQETGTMSGGRVPMKMQKALCATLRR
jgi:lipopolysaccharide export system protein LptA